MAKKRVVIVGGVAGGATCAARLRRQDEDAEIVVLERGPYVSFANCGLPYYVGNVIQEESKLLLASPTLFRERFNVEVRTRNEVLAIDRTASTVSVRGAYPPTVAGY
jgi:NADPH-dependent 2,4-dienoyl-CoA reductase/sulfur reductase-like enzyme